jgi:hypothetical protein
MPNADLVRAELSQTFESQGAESACAKNVDSRAQGLETKRSSGLAGDDGDFIRGCNVHVQEWR